MAPGNRKPFSGKQKKQLLKDRRERKANKLPLGAESDTESERESKSTTTGRSNEEIFIRKDFHEVDAQPIHGTGDELPSKSSNLPKMTEFTSSNIHAINAQPESVRCNRDVNRYALQFFRETNEELEKRKRDSAKPYVKVTNKQLEIDDERHRHFIQESIDFPKRPAWHASFSKEKLLSNEYTYFKQYLEQLESKYGSLSALSYFEMNLETWRQLWRTIEMSDIILLVTDVRYSVFHFPTALHDYIVQDLGKDIILVLNKCDLISPDLVIAWMDYWRIKFPTIHVVPFASYAGMKTKDKGKLKGKRFGKFYMASESVRLLHEACEKIVQNKIDLSEWKRKIEDDIAFGKARALSLCDELARIALENEESVEDAENDEDLEEEREDNVWEENVQDKWTDKRRLACTKKIKKPNRKVRQRAKKDKQNIPFGEDTDDEEEKLLATENAKNRNRVTIETQDYDFHEYKRLEKGILTIGCIGHPNVGKSSVLNAIMGEIVVSVSRTPGHTKHFQTIFLTKNVRLCDCPGLVFPSKVPKPLQILMGCFPIAQLREPYSAVQFIAERVNLINILKIKKSEDWDTQDWSAIEICEQWATKRGYFAAKSARPDIYRAANQLLRMALDGRTICLTFYPPKYLEQRESVWLKHEQLQAIHYLCHQVNAQDKERVFKTEKKDLCNLKVLVKNPKDVISQPSYSTDEIHSDIECP